MSTATQVNEGAVTQAAIHAVLTTGTRPPRPGRLATSLTFAWRAMLKVKHVPEQLIDVTLTPVLFTLMFTYLFGGAIAGSTQAYLQFILPAILVMSVLFTTVYSGVALNTDMTKGVVDRFRSLPIWRPSPLVGAMLGDTLRYATCSIVTLAVGIGIGFRPGGGAGGTIAGILLVIAFAVSLAWAFTTLGLVMRAPNAVMNAGFMALFPITFLSNAFVEPETLPSGLRTFVDGNPISFLITGTRSLMEGDADTLAIGVSLGTAAILTLVFAPLTSRLYRRAGS